MVFCSVPCPSCPSIFLIATPTGRNRQIEKVIRLHKLHFPESPTGTCWSCQLFPGQDKGPGAHFWAPVYFSFSLVVLQLFFFSLWKHIATEPLWRLKPTPLVGERPVKVPDGLPLADAPQLRDIGGNLLDCLHLLLEVLALDEVGQGGVALLVRHAVDLQKIK